MRKLLKFLLPTLLILLLCLLAALVANPPAKAKAKKMGAVPSLDKLTVPDFQPALEGMISPKEKTAASTSQGQQASVKALDTAQLEQKIREYLGNNIDKVGLVYYDLTSGKSIVINGDKQFLAASTVKVPMNMVLYDMVQEGKVELNQSVPYNAETDFEEGTGILQDSDLTSPIPLQTLVDDSILHSDNIATNMIIRTIDFYEMRNRMDEKLGHTTDHTDNYTTPSDSARLLELLYENPSKNPYYSRIIEDMKSTDFHDRIDAYIPSNLVAHKIGNYGIYTNDMGIIYTSHPYILAVFSSDLPDANETIAQVSRMIYEEQSKLN